MRDSASLGPPDRLIGASGHEVRLIPPSYVKPYVRRSKTDTADAQAICEAVGRPSMGFVPVKSAALLHHRVRDLLVRPRTMLINALRGHLGEFGIIAPTGRHRVVESHQFAAGCRRCRCASTGT
jgi:transposase